MHKSFICKALEVILCSKSIKKDTVFGTGSSSNGAKIRINLVSTKDFGRFLFDQYPHQEQTPQNENRQTTSGCVKIDSPACCYGLS